MDRLLTSEILDEEVTGLCGERYSRTGLLDGRFRRCGSYPGSIRIGDERVPIDVPCVRDVQAERERPLESYQQMKQPVAVGERMEEALLPGLSQRDYRRVGPAFLDGSGLSQSSASRVFVERSRRAGGLRDALAARGDFVALWIDGRYLASRQMVICLGLTMDGRKGPLGFIETTTENDGPRRRMMGLLEVEQKMPRIDHAKDLPLLRAALLREIEPQHPPEMEPLAQKHFTRLASMPPFPLTQADSPVR
ncbi:hypothetical protein AWN76_006310 [Rhodothermaceae bacterium RA]|nr:hypothetical protein AWN76_006310 [Rhodothermaceae bacterium RA]